MGLHHNHTLIKRDFANLLAQTSDYLAQMDEEIFASAEDASYFRKLYKKPAPPPLPELAPAPPPLPKLPDPPKIKEAKPEPLPEKAIPPTPRPKIEKPDLPAPLEPKGLKALFKKIAPELAILDEIPSDALAKKISSRWKTKNQSAPITLLHYQENPEQRALLEEIAKAIDVVFGPAKLADAGSIENAKQWDALLSVPELKLIICCDYTLWQLPHLMHHYKEVPAQKVRQLKNTPVFLLPDLSLYLKDAQLKRSLWKGLCQIIASLPSS